MSNNLYQQTTCNPNVPAGVFIVTEWYTLSGEIGHSIFIDPKDDYIYRVEDWVDDRPYRTALVGDLEFIDAHDLYLHYSAWKRSKEMKNNRDKIVIGYCMENMFEDTDSQDINKESSVDLFEKILTDRLVEMYPRASITFKRACPAITKFNGEGRGIEVEIINREFGYVWGGPEWIVRIR
jgi:hypothetical protein